MPSLRALSFRLAAQHSPRLLLRSTGRPTRGALPARLRGKSPADAARCSIITDAIDESRRGFDSTSGFVVADRVVCSAVAQSTVSSSRFH